MTTRPVRSLDGVRPESYDMSHDQRCRGARLVASAAKDVEDCALLLAMLGLDPADGLEPRGA
ncbi:hypothetical protein B0293_42685 [Amycolatopsis azurea DSM 43854]|uniref:Uncharacterized protein n=1 Tax=Amycolatopsis azurea DSM 43854 TaxID=1238180 RepID=A0ABX3J0R5_9PSEU|nr:hypothetical protein B0293_42685 [Amycolatopsis azurea DSM 43854]